MSETQEENQESPEETRAKTEKAARLNANHEDFQLAIGASEILDNQAQYGTDAVSAARAAFKKIEGTESYSKLEKAIYDPRKESVGERGEASKPTSSEVYAGMRQTVERESLPRLKFGELEAIVKEAGAKLDVEVPEELRDLSYEEYSKGLVEEGKVDEKGQVDESMLSDEEKNAAIVYNALRSAYTQASVAKVREGAIYAEANKGLKLVNSFYNPESEENKEEGEKAA